VSVLERRIEARLSCKTDSYERCEGVTRVATRVAVAPGLPYWAVERAGWDEQTASRRAPKLEEWVSG